MTRESQDHTTRSPDVSGALLTAIREKYLSSADFNGLAVHAGTSRPLLTAATDLVRAGLVQVMSSADYPNIHIRPWPSRRTVDEQVGSIEGLESSGGVCLYPTRLAMAGVALPERYVGRPYDEEIARGRGVLEPAFFDLGVLEPYRNDPRYHFSFDDFGADMFVSDAVYEDHTEPERDKVSLAHIGFAYDLRDYDPEVPESPVVRRVAVFFKDLSRLSAEHQHRWRSYQVDDDGLSPHPMWFAMQMGQWPDGTGPFARLQAEMENINVLWKSLYGRPLFRTTDQPRELGWLLRPSRRDWEEFILQLDKLLSDNLDSKALDAAGAPKTNANGDSIGTLSRLDGFMVQKNVNPDAARAVLKPLRDIRKARQQPAHALTANTTDQTAIRRQVDLLWDLNDSLYDIRRWLSTHPNTKQLSLPHSDDSLGKSYRM